MQAAMLEYVRAGLSVIPAHPTAKNPLVESWIRFQRALPTAADIAEWERGCGKYSPAIIAGEVSGNLEVLDFDDMGRQFPTWVELVTEQSPNLPSKLVQQRTQNGGMHVIYRCDDVDIPGNQKLSIGAINVPAAGEHSHGGKDYKAIRYRDRWVITPTLIETRGAGGYFLAAPGSGYELTSGSFSSIPVITARERDILIECAKILTEYVKEQPAHRTSGNGGELPGDIFCREISIQDLIAADGWTNSGRTKSLPDGTMCEQWCRPGKRRGVSATVFDNKIHVFTSNAPPLEPSKTYNPFSYYVTMKHNGDYSAGAKELSNNGYGVSRCQQMSADVSSGKHLEANVCGREQISSFCQQDVSRQENEKPIALLIREFVENNSGTFHVRELDQELNLVSRGDKNNRSKVLARLEKDMLVKKVAGKTGCWKAIDGSVRRMKLGAVQVNPLELTLPLGLSDLAHILPGNIILVAGAPNGGKTAFLLTSLYTIIKNKKNISKNRANINNIGNSPAPFEGGVSVSQLMGNGIRYLNSEMDEMELTDRCAAYPDGMEVFQDGCEFVQRYRDFADVIIPDGINFIDFLEIHEDFFELGKLINEIFENLTIGICFIAVQKKAGADFAKGGAASLEKPRLAINLDPNSGYGKICKIMKCKKPVRAGDNHDGKEVDFGLIDGVQFVRYSPWRHVSEKERKRVNNDYEVHGVRPIPEKNYSFCIRLTDGSMGRIEAKQVEEWKLNFKYVNVEAELSRIEDDSRVRPFLKKNGWFHAVSSILGKVPVER